MGVCLAKLVPVGYGIKKLQIGCVVEDDKVRSFPSAVGCCVVKAVLLDFPVCSSGGHRHPGGTHHCLRGLCSVDGRCSFQQDLKMRPSIKALQHNTCLFNFLKVSVIYKLPLFLIGLKGGSLSVWDMGKMSYINKIKKSLVLYSRFHVHVAT